MPLKDGAPVILMLDDKPQPHKDFDVLVTKIAKGLGYEPADMLEHVVHCTRSAHLMAACADRKVVMVFSDNMLDSTSTKERVFANVKKNNQDAILVWASNHGFTPEEARDISAATNNSPFLVVLKDIWRDTLLEYKFNTQDVKKAFESVRYMEVGQLAIESPDRPFGNFTDISQHPVLGHINLNEAMRWHAIYAIGKACEQIAAYRTQSVGTPEPTMSPLPPPNQTPEKPGPTI